ncbi:MAG: hypothetical protein SynsKO_28770 [Synoicihabitans sp.]
MIKRSFLLAVFALSLGFVNAASADSVVAVPTPGVISPAGGQLSVAIDILYEGQPSALGLALALPEGWSLAGVAGKNAPPIAAEAGTTESAEFAWMSPPSGGANLVLKVNYPAGSQVGVLSGFAEIRRSGKSLRLQVAVPLGR